MTKILNFFRRKRLAREFALKERRAHIRFELWLLDYEKLDQKPYPLRLRYTRDQAIAAIYQRVQRKFAELGVPPPRRLREIVEGECRGV